MPASSVEVSLGRYSGRRSTVGLCRTGYLGNDGADDVAFVPTMMSAALHGSSRDICPASAETRPLAINARAGAYLVGALDGVTIAREAKGIEAPVNRIAGRTTPPPAKLAGIGESGVSLEPRSMRAASALIRKMDGELLDRGTNELMSSDTMNYSEINRMLGPESTT